MSEASVLYADGACMPQPFEAYGISAPGYPTRKSPCAVGHSKPQMISTHPD